MAQAKHDPRKGVRGEMHSKAKLDWDKVRHIRANSKLSADHEDYLTHKRLAELYGVSEGAISQVVYHKTWKE